MEEVVSGLELDYAQWVEILTEKFGLQRYRADQICQWIYQKKILNFYDMTNLSKDLREKLTSTILVMPPILVRQEVSQDGTKKFLWQLQDGERIESVLLSQEKRLTACLSTQVGCPLSCSFCASGQEGLVRNLSVGEIVGQFIAMEKIVNRDIDNIVFMGMGEPFLNQDVLCKSIQILNDPKMRGLGMRHITISTAGVVPGILALAELKIPVKLSLSLHAPNDQLRNKLMSINRQYPLALLMEALWKYQHATNDRITIEYLMMNGVNDSVERAYELITLLNGLSVYVNLIPYNPIKGKKFKRPSDSRIKAFGNVLSQQNIEYEIRRERGSDISAACGQLRLKYKIDQPSSPK